jgi:hypothetical protein
MNAISHMTDAGYKGVVLKSLGSAKAALLGQPDNHRTGELVVSTTDDLKRHLREMQNETGFQIPDKFLSASVVQLSREESLAHRVPVWKLLSVTLAEYCDYLQCVTQMDRAKWFLGVLDEVDSFLLDRKDFARLKAELEGKMIDRAQKARRGLYRYQSLMLNDLKQLSMRIEEEGTAPDKKLKEKALAIVEEMLRILQ